MSQRIEKIGVMLEGGLTNAEICRALGLSEMNLFKSVERAGLRIETVSTKRRLAPRPSKATEVQG